MPNNSNNPQAESRGATPSSRIVSPQTLNAEQAIQTFIQEWCYPCEIFNLLRGAPLSSLKLTCSPSTINTCPTYKKIIAAITTFGPTQAVGPT